ncbi:unnamed protein product, partial [Rotaria socialis]
ISFSLYNKPCSHESSRIVRDYFTRLWLAQTLGERTRCCINLTQTKICSECVGWMYPGETVLKIFYYSGGINCYHNRNPCRPAPVPRQHPPAARRN